MPHRLSKPARLRVGVIGTGRVGSVLGAALARVGHHVDSAYAVSDASLARARALLPGIAVRSPEEVLAGSDLVLVTVPDDALGPLVDGLVSRGAVRPGHLLVHTSGRHGVAVMSAAAGVGAHPLALHPAMTFTGTAVDLARLPGTVFGVTAAESMRPVAEALVLELGGEPMWVPESSRVLYHAALAHGANHLVTLVAESMELLTAAGVDDPAATLRPLLSAALDNALRSGDGALTGPVARGDAGTVGAHIREIGEVSASSAHAYLELATLTAARAIASGRLRGLSEAAIREVLASHRGSDLLAGESPVGDALGGEEAQGSEARA